MRSRLRYVGVVLLVISAIVGVAVAYVSHTIPSALGTSQGFDALAYSDAAFFALSIVLLVASIIPSRKMFKTRSETIVDQHPVVETPQPETGSPADNQPPGNQPLTLLEMTLIRYLPETKDEKRLSKLTAVDIQIISQKLDNLRDRGYITKDLKLTEKGFEILNSPGMQGVATGTEKGAIPGSAQVPARQTGFGSTKTDYYRIVAGIGILALVVALFAPWISDITSGVGLSLADIYNIIIQALAQPSTTSAGQSTASQINTGGYVAAEVALLLSFVFYPMALILSSLALRFRRCAIAGGIFAVITSLLFVFAFDSLTLTSPAQPSSGGFLSASPVVPDLVVIGYGVYLEIVAGVLVTISYFVSRPN